MKLNNQMALLEIKNISKSFSGLKAVDDFSCSIDKGTITGLIGPNGAGKTTVFNIITGFLDQDSGTYVLNGKDLSNLPAYEITQRRMVRTFQDLRLIKELPVIENVLLFFRENPGEKLFNVFFRERRIRETGKTNLEKAESLLEFAGIHEKKNDNAGNLSYGQQKLLSICCCLAADPEIILLDEPVSGVQPATIERISFLIKELVEKKNKTVFFIEHNMDFVFKNCDKIIVMDHGVKIAEGNPSEIKNNREILEAYLD